MCSYRPVKVSLYDEAITWTFKKNQNEFNTKVFSFLSRYFD